MGFSNGVLTAINVDFTGNQQAAAQVTANGQLLIGSAVAPNIRVGTLSAGTGIAITNGAGTISISATGSEMVWNDVSTNFGASSGNGYFVIATCSGTLPPNPGQGNTISFAVDAATTTLTITANVGQIIRVGTTVSAAAGTAVSNSRGDSLTLVFRAADNAWIATSVIGTWVVS